MATTDPTEALLALEDGRVFHGVGFGARATTTGEVCFNTSMTGYQEILTDPSYRGQIVTMTYPEIGNYGVNFLDVESQVPHVRGFVISELSPVVSSWRAQGSLSDYLTQNGIPGIQEIDTRALTKHLRVAGAMRGCLSTEGISAETAVQLARESAPMQGSDFVKEVMPSEAYDWDAAGEQSREWIVKKGPHFVGDGKFVQDEKGNFFSELRETKARIVALDFGMKENILRLLRRHGFEVRVLPPSATPEEILSESPVGLFLSNGPGDPATLGYAHETVRSLVGKLPIFGICLGHQIIALALGGKTFKLKFGHRGANQPVKDFRSGKISITSQNHGFAVDPDSLSSDIEVTHLNLNDGTVAGLRHRLHPVFSVQFHPEASPGPHDAEDFFAEFAKVVEQNRELTV